MRPTDFRLPGAVDLSGLKARATAPQDDAPAANGAHVIDVTEADFEALVVQQSMQTPVVLDFWASWCGPCKQLSPVLERMAEADGGAWVLAKIDCDAEQRLAAAFQVQSIPSVFAVIGGQPVPLFQGALPEQQIRPVIDEVLRVAAANGVTGRHAATAVADGAVPTEDAEPQPLSPQQQARLAAQDAAADAIERGDYAGAVAVLTDALAKDPGDDDAKAMLLQAQLFDRADGLDPAELHSRADAAPDDVDAQLAAADADLLVGDAQAAIDRLVGLVRRTAGPERDAARQRLLDVFEILDPEDPRVAAGRRALASALF